VRRAVPGLAFLVAVLLGSSGALAAPPAPMHWTANQRTLQQPVEQQTPGGATQPDRSLWVVNPTPCAWDPDDIITGMFTGVIAKGQTVTHSECVILDTQNHLVGLSVGAGLSGWISVGTPTGATIGGSLEAGACLLTPEYGDPQHLALPEIGAGHGDRVSVTWSVTNVSGHRLGKAIAITTIGPTRSDWRANWGC